MFNDSPIERQSMSTMTEAQLLAQIELMQERRMRSYTVYQQALEAKAEIKSVKDGEQLQKRLDQMAKLFVSVDNGLDKLRKYAAEVQVIRLTLGD